MGPVSYNNCAELFYCIFIVAMSTEISSPLIRDKQNSEFLSSKRSRIRKRQRASYQRDKAYKLIDDLKLGHMGLICDGQLVVIPMTIWRVGDELFFHCINKSRLQRHLEKGEEVCISFAEATEWVMTKSAFHHSTNYRSAVLFCTGDRVTNPEEFDNAFKVIINQIEQNRWDNVRPPNSKERKATALMRLSIAEGSFKCRDEGPSEEPEDLALPVWHGTKPICPFHPTK